ncbi:glycosyl transferase [Pedobacter sp. MC2016-24]|uniref:glycosyl transferase n=1 Tax=Pedobacter sp. MC2016-24 TaxID=2780090 RepID=UPI0018803D51|nr:glycosyl transferase [Pedobacter sp. MC2016-24]MBE9597928.1 glycosyl transferase [Pedobacter sp. MC2016-24]
MLQFCTLFNSNYLSRGLAMYNSLEEQCADFHLYIFAFDTNCFDVLSKLNLANATVISLSQFENKDLLAVKGDRTAAEYCWTCSSSTIKYCLETYHLDHCTYVDADLLFFSDPIVLYKEMGEKSVLITEHRYTPCYDQSATSGIYCVQFMTFKNTKEGMEVLNWWVDACLEWCFNRMEDNKFGDQKYLDDWTTRFNCVHVLANLGGGVAPWNVQQHDFKTKSKNVKGLELATGKNFDLVFYHYHGFKYSLNNSYKLSPEVYHLTSKTIKSIYRPYVKALSVAEFMVKALDQETETYAVTNDIEWVKKVIGRSLLFNLRGFYKNYYKARSFNYSFLNTFNLF